MSVATSKGEEGRRYLCIHGHFYQPPRENPWLEAVEVQDSAAPYHDWNERVSAECYEPNAHARILDERGLIARIISTYERISWNFGPTLLAWMEGRAPQLYQAVKRADIESQRRFSGHGSALAQAYNHAILPLCNSRDKRTQILWGLRDFKHRFGRLPEGMWLPETAVDLESLDIMAELGVRFSILAPHQARAVRRLSEKSVGEGAFVDVSGARIDPKRAYLLNLPSGRSITLFFYDGPVSRAVAFERLLDRGEDLMSRLMSTFAPGGKDAQLVHIATDGETYGHHHKYGEMALAYSIDKLERRSSDVVLTNYGEFLARHPPTHEVQIFENTSWSCAHGVERWRSDCGCNTGGQPGWHQSWRAPLRAALDFLRDAVTPIFEQAAAPLLHDPWAARDEYIDVMLDRSERSRARFVAAQGKGRLDAAAQIKIWKLMELQRHAQLMYTSCGWFFSDLGGPETVQDIQYAGRTLQLAAELGAPYLESQFIERLDAARGNTVELPTGSAVYAFAVQRSRADLCHVGAHHAISALFAGGGEKPAAGRLYCYSVTQAEHRQRHAGKLRLGIGRVRIRSDITLDEASLYYGALHLGDHNVAAGVLIDSEGGSKNSCDRLVAELEPPFSRGDLPELLRTLDRLFAPRTYSLKHLFRDEQRDIVGIILGKTLRSVSSTLSSLYEHHAPLLRFLVDLDVPQPLPLQKVAELSLNGSLLAALSTAPLDPAHIARLIDEAGRAGVPIDHEPLRFALVATLDRLLSRSLAEPEDRHGLSALLDAVELAAAPPFQVNLWKAQNAYAELLGSVYPLARARARKGAQDLEATEWVRLFVQLGERLQVKLPDVS